MAFGLHHLQLEGTDGPGFKKSPLSGNVFIACIVSFEFCATSVYNFCFLIWS